MSREAFNPLTDQGLGTSSHLAFTAGSASSANEVTYAGDVMIAVRSADIYWRWGKAGSSVSASTATTQGGWLPQNTVIRMHKPENATHLLLLRDSGTTDAQVYVTPGNGI